MLKLMTSLFAILFLSLPAWSDSPANPELLERFLVANQKSAVTFFTENIENHSKILNCLKLKSYCSGVEIQTAVNSEQVALTFTQQDLIDFMRERHQEYRTIVGMTYFPAIRTGLSIGRGKMTLTPMTRAGHLLFENQSEEGKAEIARLEKLYNNEIKEMQKHNIWLAEQEIDKVNVKATDFMTFAHHQLSLYLQKYPFLSHMHKLDDSKQILIESIAKTVEDYNSALTHVNGLKGKDRFEILGFISIFQDTMFSFSEKDRKALVAHFQYMKDQDSTWNRIKQIVFNWYTVGMVACYTAAIVFPPTALICGAIGLAFAVPGIYNLAQNTGRLFDYMSTGQYDSDVFGKYMTSNFVSGVMYTIWLSGMLPGFTKNLANVKSMATEAIKKIQITKGQLGITTREALLAEYNLIKRYVQYYSKEITLDGTFDTIARFSGKTNLIIPHASRVLLLTATQIRNRSPRIFQYSDMLAVTRASMAAVK